MVNIFHMARKNRATIFVGIGVPSKSGATVTRPLKKDSGFFYVPCCAGSMAPFLAGRVGASKDAPVPDSGTPTLHGLPPSIGVVGGRFKTCQSGANMADISTPKMGALETVLRAILAEVTPGQRPYSSDSYLPGHLIEAAQTALAGTDQAACQHAHNALSTAAWHIARGEAPQALARMRRAQSHILASMEATA